MTSQPAPLSVITGATSGFGRATALHLAGEGRSICMVARSPDRAAAVAAEIEAVSSTEPIVVIADLSSLDEVRRAGEEIAALSRPIELLVNNAGAIFGFRRQESVDGIEQTMALNHFAYFVLTEALIEQVRAADDGRVVNVASDAYSFVKGRFDFDEWQGERRYRPHRQYGLSKLANILFTAELARREPTAVQTVAWAPGGLVATRFAYGANRLAPLAMKLTHPFAQSTEDAVVPLLDLCTRPLAADEHGAFFIADERHEVDVAPDEDAARLWELSAEMVAGDRG